MAWFSIINKDNGTTGEIYIYGAIVDEKWYENDPDVTPVEFKEQLDQLRDAKMIDLYVNSPGGNVWAGMAIYHMLKRHGAYVTGHVDGVAASISSVLLMSADKIIAPKTSMMLAHKPLIAGYVYGNANDFRKLSDDLDKVEEVIVNAYVEKTGLKAETIREIMEKDEYMTGEEAVNSGFADAIDDSTVIMASVENEVAVINGRTFNVKDYRKLPVEKVKNIFAPKQIKCKDKNVDAALKYYENKLSYSLINT
jgi:ATP-dependent Clp protease, protease subunit